MKILHVSDCYLPRLGGIETQVHDLAQRQRDAGHEASVLTATPPARHDPRHGLGHDPRHGLGHDPRHDPRHGLGRADQCVEVSDEVADEVSDDVPVRRLAVDLPFELPVHPWPMPAARRILRDGAYDVVHLHAGVVSPFAFAVAPVVVRAGVPLVVTVHSMWGPATPLFAAVSALTGVRRSPAVLTAVSEAAAGPVRRATGVPVEVLPNGIDADVWRVPPDELEPRDPDDVLVVAVMRLAPRKRPLALLRVLAGARDRLPSRVGLRAVVLGEGPQRASMERHLARRGMTGWVELPGRVGRDHLRSLYRRADLFVAPARLESFGIAALEARTAGLPVVATSRGGVGEFVTDGVEGLLADDDAGLAEAVARLAGDPALRARMSAHNRAVPPRMTWPDVLAACDGLYRRAGASAGR